MPELPDLQAFSRNLTKIFKGKKVDRAEVEVNRKLNVSVKELQEALHGQEIEKFIRQGKELHILFKSGQALGLHLMLHGQLIVTHDKDELPKNQIISLQFDDGTRLVLTDFQKAATPTLNPKKTDVPDALDVKENYLFEKFSKTKTPVKTVLMDQKIV
ncbi:MAG: DNA-formamidopyrimidine glycosylase family protein, partial [Mucilaginibacter sp.]